MKQTTLEDLYYGNINPNEISFVIIADLSIKNSIKVHF